VPVPTGLPEDSRRAVRDNLGFARNERIIGIVAHILPHKGYDDLVHALSLVVERCPMVRCLVVGDAPRRRYLGHLLNLADRLGVRGRLVFVGEQEDVAPFVDAMDVFVLPSLTEGLPLTVLEAMAVGKPVVGTDVGGISEAVRHGETGFVVPPRDPRKLAEALIGLLGDPSSARAMGEAGRRRVEKAFTMDNEVAQTVRTYRRIVSCARPGAG
jgi:glycosyltransferase involved in cell wall biosynthesis